MGFGADIPGVTSKEPSHCFAINGDAFNPEIQGIANVENVYKKVLQNIKLSGPTYFQQIIKFVNDMAEFDMSSK